MIALLVPVDLTLEEPTEVLEVPKVVGLVELDDTAVLIGELVAWLLIVLEVCDA